MTPSERYETIDEAYREREAICLVGGMTHEQANKVANIERARREGRAMSEMGQQDRADYLEIVGKRRGRVEMRLLQIFYTNHFATERRSGTIAPRNQTTGATP